MKEQFWHAEPGDAVVENVPDERFAEPPDAIAQGVLGQAIARLSPEHQQVIKMFADGMKPQEIVAALGIPRSEVAKALRMLRKSINDVIHGRVRK
jgi:DNA-directed RNA polymerase specialized sigma24 family protein